MSSENIDLGGLTMEKLFKDANMPLGQIKMQSPARKINIEMDDKLFVLGFNLFCEGYNTAKYDLADLKPTTLINIERFHLIECMYMIIGATYAASLLIKSKNRKHLTIEDFCDKFFIYFKDGLVKYKKLLYDAEGYPYSIFNLNYKDEEKLDIILERLTTICKNIWFLPYSEIEEMKEKISKEV